MIIKPYSWIEIDKAALLNNAAVFKTITGSGSFLAPVIKANGYGHGIELIAHIFDACDDIDLLCVGYLSEALALRAAGIKKAVLVMSCIDDNPEKARGENIHFIIGDMQKLSTVALAAQKTNTTFDIHLKIDTGLSRFGVTPEDALGMIECIKKLPHIRLAGICTHFAESYKEDQNFTHQQIDAFKHIVESIDQKPLYIHASNSAATVIAQVPYATMFRVGLGIYGYWPNTFAQQNACMRTKNSTLIPALSWKTRVMETKWIKKGMSIGYDRTYIAQIDTLIALLPVGYYDGYDFRLCNNSLVYIDDQPYPLIGKVAMNTLIIDITKNPHILIGTEVLLLGDKPGITAHDFGVRIGEPNPRKILSILGAHLPRIVV